MIWYDNGFSALLTPYNYYVIWYDNGFLTLLTPYNYYMIWYDNGFSTLLTPYNYYMIWYDKGFDSYPYDSQDKINPYISYCWLMLGVLDVTIAML